MWYSQERTVEVSFLGQPISLLQDNESLHVGTSVWEASLVMADFLQRQSQQHGSPFHIKAVCGRRAIDLGAGCGLAGMALALLGAHVTATDIPAVLPHLRRNVKRNMARAAAGLRAEHGEPGRVKVLPLCWGKAKQIEAVRPPFEFVVVADVVYLEEHVDALLETMHAMCSETTVVLLGYRQRQEEAHARFWERVEDFFSVSPAEQAASERATGFGKEKSGACGGHMGVELFLLAPRRRNQPLEEAAS